MDLVSDGKLAATVSRAGAFGIIGGGYGNEEWLARELDAAGDARVGVGFITWSMAKNPRLLDMALERRPAAIMLSFGDPSPFADRIRDAGVLLILQVTDLDEARRAVDLGDKLLLPTHYSIRHYSSWDTEALRNWIRQAEADHGERADRYRCSRRTGDWRRRTRRCAVSTTYCVRRVHFSRPEIDPTRRRS